MADSIFLEPVKRWFQNRLTRQPAQSGDDAAVGGEDASDQLRSILAAQRGDGTSPVEKPALSQVMTTDSSGINVLECPQCHESYEANSQFCSKCGCGLSPIDRSLPPIQASSEGIITRVRLDGSPEGQTGRVENVTSDSGEQQLNFGESHDSDSEEDVSEADNLVSPESVDSMTSNLRSLFTRTSVLNQETKDLLERYGTVDVHLLIDELNDLAVSIGARSRGTRR
jgi:hypothetical protein